MNKKERDRILRVQTCIAQITRLCPFNASSIARKAVVSDCMASAGNSLYHAIASIGFGDFKHADGCLEDAERAIVRASESVEALEKREFSHSRE